MAIPNSSRREKHSYIQTLQISKVIEACWKFAGFDKDVKGSYDGSGRKPSITSMRSDVSVKNCQTSKHCRQRSVRKKDRKMRSQDVTMMFVDLAPPLQLESSYLCRSRSSQRTTLQHKEAPCSCPSAVVYVSKTVSTSFHSPLSLHSQYPFFPVLNLQTSSSPSSPLTISKNLGFHSTP